MPAYSQPPLHVFFTSVLLYETCTQLDLWIRIRRIRNKLASLILIWIYLFSKDSIKCQNSSIRVYGQVAAISSPEIVGQ
jgi:hypothetical protein